MGKSKWSSATHKLVKELHSELTLSNKNWHQLKNNSERRAAELLISAIAQIINGGETSDIQSLIHQALLWLNKEIKDPGCPSH
ncbi:DUF6439 family protein [Prochlorococcus marinus]|uniref:Uncharacterized protein n=1 Tax=Prochlorococcus marinus (strain MIT 9211) TaxID=93059 RepID=A9B9Z3_PROM4|nr:DUF6439 family protein [Prochlorococcus marinus]ABX08655.1 conserved hypothetical protein [Prochlorococcus marinus str. MIT 9211]